MENNHQQDNYPQGNYPQGNRVYNQNSGNPFIPTDTPSCWTVNELLLKDPKLRSLSGVCVLDEGVTATYLVNPNSGKY